METDIRFVMHFMQRQDQDLNSLSSVTVSIESKLVEQITAVVKKV
jgi:hypothetical protein